MVKSTVADDLAAIARIDAVPKILEVVCRTTGLGYLTMMRDKPFFWEEFIVPKFLKQADNQLTAAAGRPIEWHFAEKEVADYVRDRFATEKLPITVIYTPLSESRP
jgi:hypothetical protein